MAKITFIKAQASSFIASAIDYLIYLMLTMVAGVWYLPASIASTVVGGMVNFLLGRNWVFQGGENGVGAQAFRYLVVWIGYLILITAVVYAATHFLHIDYRLSKIIAGLVIGFTYNYFLQKKFVYR